MMHLTYSCKAACMSLPLRPQQITLEPRPSCLSAGRIAHCEGPRPSFDCPYIRVSFASATNADLVEGVKRLATVIRKFKQDAADKPEAKAHSNGNAVHLEAKADSSNGGHFARHKPASEIVHEQEQNMHLKDAVHSAADSQPEAC